MDPLGGAEDGWGVAHGPQVVHPGAGGVDDHPAANEAGFATQVVAEANAGCLAVLAQKLDDLGMVDGGAAVLGCGADVGQGEAGVVDEAFEVAEAAAEAIWAQSRLQTQHLFRREHLVMLDALGAGEEIVGHEAGLELPASAAGTLVDRQDEGEGAH